MTTQTYAYMIRPTRLEMLTSGTTTEEAEIISQHADYLAELAEKQVVVFIGRTLTTDEGTFGLNVLKAGSEEEARQIMQNDPAVRLGVMSARLFPFKLLHMSPAQSEWFDVS